ncbi:MAG TPA: hypothetical protein VL614_13105 [Acetobacteraceae bacterium]|jgi:hypothetical protein|nr:hypothetical protein [Acetobacteraceae bacterium]
MSVGRPDVEIEGGRRIADLADRGLIQMLEEGLGHQELTHERAVATIDAGILVGELDLLDAEFVAALFHKESAPTQLLIERFR